MRRARDREGGCLAVRDVGVETQNFALKSALIFDIGPVTRDERRLEFSLPSIRNSVLGFVVKPLTFHNEKPDTMVRRVVTMRRALFSRFSLRFLAAPTMRRGFEGAPLSFFRAEAAASNRIGAEG